MVTPENNNKYYNCFPKDDTVVVEYGRVDVSKVTTSFPLSMWDSKISSKLKKGYKDVTDLKKDLVAEISATNPLDGYQEIQDKAIREIVSRLQQMANDTIIKNYSVKSASVTQAMVDEAQSIIDELVNIKTLEEFNYKLISIFFVIPRKMGRVRDYLAKDESDFAKIIQREQNLLDVMRGQICTIPAVSADEDKDKDQHAMTILEENGIEFEKCSDEEIEMIKRKLGSCADKFYDAWKVKNNATDKRFHEFIQANNIHDTRLFWHGSRNENWWSIIKSGWKLRPANAVITGKMLGYGTYWSPKARKSFGYTSYCGSYWARGNSKCAFMALVEVAYGKPYDVYQFDSRFYDLNYEKLQKMCPGAQCVHAHAGDMVKNDEICIYREDQCTIRYLVELR
jgi:poly [ADP-ribose] polymerase